MTWKFLFYGLVFTVLEVAMYGTKGEGDHRSYPDVGNELQQGLTWQDMHTYERVVQMPQE